MSGCQTVNYGGTVVNICRGPAMTEVSRDSQGVKWCFKCRKRREFFLIITAPTEVSYYGPNASIRCDHCETSDGDMFPGYEREWE